MSKRTLFTSIGLCFGIGIGAILALLFTVFYNIVSSVGLESLGTMNPLNDKTYMIICIGLVVFTTIFSGLMGFLLAKLHHENRRS